MDFNEKILHYLKDRVVLKPLTRWNEAYKEFPRYVMEYLVAKYVDPDNPVLGQQKIDRVLTDHYVDSGAKELIKSRIKEKGEYTLLGQLQVRLDAGRDHYWAEVPALGDNFVRVGRRVLNEYGEVLLAGGAWGTMVIEYDPKYEFGGRLYPFYIREFTPFQITHISLENYIEKRRLFNIEEWIDLLIQSIGFNPQRIKEREKMLMLLRLVPFVEANYNLIELGPRETGKTYTYRNTSSRSFVISGGKTTPAVLFYHRGTRKIGILGQKDVVFFDEIANTAFTDSDATISILKDYMQSGKFSRGDMEFSAQASIVLAGNIDTDVRKDQPADHYLHLFEVLPSDLREDSAFLDRLHAFIPGWNIHKIQPEKYAQGYGFVTDYLAEIFTRLRRKNYQTIVNAHVEFGQMTGRNQNSIKKTTAGLLKLIFPHRNPQDILPEELKTCMDLAIESRQLVVDQLAILTPNEFSNLNLGKSIKYLF